jgi:hypothetical protein
VNKATDHAKIKITTVRMAVAMLELTCSTPIFARMAVSPAKNAESKAQRNQFIFSPTSNFHDGPQIDPEDSAVFYIDANAYVIFFAPFRGEAATDRMGMERYGCGFSSG